MNVLYIWEFRSLRDCGHMALSLFDDHNESYISQWPTKKITETTPLLRTLEHDIQERGRGPDQTLEIPVEILDTKRISSWWSEKISQPQYNLESLKKCSPHVACTAIQEGILNPKFWTAHFDINARLIIPQDVYTAMRELCWIHHASSASDVFKSNVQSNDDATQQQLDIVAQHDSLPSVMNTFVSSFVNEIEQSSEFRNQKSKAILTKSLFGSLKSLSLFGTKLAYLQIKQIQNWEIQFRQQQHENLTKALEKEDLTESHMFRYQLIKLAVNHFRIYENLFTRLFSLKTESEISDDDENDEENVENKPFHKIVKSVARLWIGHCLDEEENFDNSICNSIAWGRRQQMAEADLPISLYGDHGSSGEDDEGPGQTYTLYDLHYLSVPIFKRQSDQKIFTLKDGRRATSSGATGGHERNYQKNPNLGQKLVRRMFPSERDILVHRQNQEQHHLLFCDDVTEIFPDLDTNTIEDRTENMENDDAYQVFEFMQNSSECHNFFQVVNPIPQAKLRKLGQIYQNQRMDVSKRIDKIRQSIRYLNQCFSGIENGPGSMILVAIDQGEVKAKDRIWFEVEPPSSKCFVGRSQFLEKLHQTLFPFPGNQSEDEAETVATRQPMAPTVLCGLPGVGKTEVARHYISNFGHLYHHVVWIDATDVSTMLDSFSRLAEQVDINDVAIMKKLWRQLSLQKTATPYEAKGACSTKTLKNFELAATPVGDDCAHKLLTKIKSIAKKISDEKTLFIFDNAEDQDDLSEMNFLENFVSSEFSETQKTYPAILITSRAHVWNPNTKSLPNILVLEPLPLDKTSELILLKLGLESTEENLEQASSLAELTGGIPLAVCSAIKYIQKRTKMRNGPSAIPNFTISNYLAQFGWPMKKSSQEKLHAFFSCNPSPSEKTLFDHFDQLFHKIKENFENGPLALKILNILCFFCPSREIPYDLIFTIVTAQEAEESIGSGRHFGHGLNLLKKYGLIVLNIQNGHISICVPEMQLVILQNLQKSGEMPQILDLLMTRFLAIIDSPKNNRKNIPLDCQPMWKVLEDFGEVIPHKKVTCTSYLSK